MQTMSGRTPACSTANSVPVRPKPVATSSHTRSTSARRHAAATAASSDGSCRYMPLAPCTSGSTTTAATCCPCSASSASKASTAPGVPRRGDRSTGKRSGSNTSVPKPPSPTEIAADGVAVVRRAEGHVGGAVGDALVGPELERHLDGLLHRGGAVGGEQEVRLVDGDDRGERLGQLDHRAVAVAEQRGVRDEVELVAHRLVELGQVVPEGGDPQRRDGVEVAPPGHVDELTALGALDDDRPVLGVAGHLREPVPHDGGIAGDPAVVVGILGHGLERTS